MTDSFTEITHLNWFTRIRQSLAGVLMGFVFIVISFPLLWMNEGCAVKKYKAIKEGRGAGGALAQPEVNPANEGALVHLSGKVTTDETLTLPLFNVSSQALKLEAAVEMYQWEENQSTKTEKKVGGGETRTTTYTYKKKWSPTVIDSSGFKKPDGHRNPGSMPFESKTVYAKEATIGEFTMTRALLEKISNKQKLDAGDTVPPDLGENAKTYQQGFYIGANPDNPAIGDTRIFFHETPPGEVSIVAQQIKNTFQPYQAKTGKLQLLQDGIHSADAMFTKAENDQMLLTWGLRLGGFLLMLAGLVMILKPLSVFADVIPLIGSIVGAGAFFLSTVVAFALTLLTVASAWIFYRPLVGIGLLVLGCLAGGSIFFLIKKIAATQSESASGGPSGDTPAAGKTADAPPPPAPPTANREFYLYVNDETLGHYAETDLRAYLSSGQVQPETLCVPVGEQEWKPVSQCL